MRSILTVTSAASSFDLTRLATLKTELGVSGSGEDAYLGTLITQASRQIATFCGRVLVRQTYTEVFRQIWDRDALLLSAFPVSSITSVTEATVLDAAYYAFDQDGKLYRLDAGDRQIRWTAAKATVVYSAGYIIPSDVGANLPADIERACIDLCVMAYAAKGRDRLLRSEKVLDVIDQSFFDPDKLVMEGGLPGDIAQRLNPYRTVALS